MKRKTGVKIGKNCSVRENEPKAKISVRMGHIGNIDKEKSGKK